MMILQPLRKKPTFVICFIVTLFLAGNAVGQIIDRVIAVVNDDVILLSDLQDAGKQYFQKIKEQTPEASLQETMQKAENEVLDNLIDKNLVTQKAKKDKIRVTDEDFQHAYQLMVKHSGLTKEQFVDKMKKSGITQQDYDKDLRYQILQEKLINHDIRSKVVITDNMVKKYYDQHKMEYNKTKGGYALLQMGFTWGTTAESQKSAPNMFADKLDAKRRAEEVRKMAEEGQDFRELAKKYSNLPSAADGGDIGTLQDDDMAADMRDAITSLKPGQISKIIETRAGFQFFKLLASKDGVDPKSSYESAQEGIRDILYQQQMKKEFDNWVKNLKQQAYIKKMYP
jgi:peptidyl-prolyl cis-trans isomerase SurA